MSLLTKYSTPAERARKCRWVDRFYSQGLVSQNGGSITGSPTFSITNGVTLDGINDYLRYNLTGNEFNSDQISIVMEFTPDFDPTDNSYIIFNDTNNGSRYLIYKNINGGETSNALIFYLGNAGIGNAPYATYSPYWNTGRNVLVVSGTSGNNKVWLNGHLIFSNSAAWTAKQPTDLWIGASYNGGSVFPGTIHSFQVYQSLLTEEESTILYTRDRSIIQDLISEGSLVLYHDYRSGSADDLSGQGNNGTVSGSEWSRNGLNFMETNDKVSFDNATELELSSALTIVAFTEPFGRIDPVGLAYGRLIEKGSNYIFAIKTDYTKYYFSSGVSAVTVNADPRGKQYHAVSMTSGSTPALYQDGIYIGNFNGSLSLTSDSNNGAIGNATTGGANLGSPIKALLIFNRVLTALEHQTLYQELNFMAW